MSLAKAVAKDKADVEAQSWVETEFVSYRVNVVVNGFGLSRDINERVEGSFSGATEAEVRAVVKKLRNKGFDAQCWKRVSKSQRIV